MKIPILIDFQPKVQGRTHVILFHRDNKDLVGAKIFIRGNRLRPSQRSIKTKLAHEFGHIIMGLFAPVISHSAAKEFNEEVVAWEEPKIWV